MKPVMTKTRQLVRTFKIDDIVYDRCEFFEKRTSWLGHGYNSPENEIINVRYKCFDTLNRTESYINKDDVQFKELENIYESLLEEEEYNYYYERYEEFITGSKGGISSEDETYEWYKTGYYDERNIRIDKRWADWDLENKIKICAKNGFGEWVNASKPQLQAVCDLVKKYHEIKEKKNEKPTKSVKSRKSKNS